MLKNLLKIVIRNIIKDFGYSSLNIIGLTIGIASALFLIIYVSDEESYDRYHEKADRFEDRFSTDVSFSSDDFENGYDFNFRQFRSNLVARWEYRPESLIYLVWTQSRTGRVDNGSFAFTNDIDGLFSVYPYNVFLVKLSYRFGN
jgi:hypothetical protein